MLPSLLLGNVYDDDDDDDDYDDNILGGVCDCNSTWSCENRVSKHFVIFLNFLCLIACLLCCLLKLLFLLVLWLVICVEVHVDGIIILPPPPPPPSLPHYFFVFTHSSLFNTTDSYLKSVHA